MSLYVRVSTGFFGNRKTHKLKAVLGNDAFWVPVKLWAYAADSQPDGDFSGFSAEELASVIGYTGDAQALLQALLQACFLDSDMRIHGWQEHNSYHLSFAERARKAANARWNKSTPPSDSLPEEKGLEKNRKERKRDKHCLSIAPSIAYASGAKESPPTSDSKSFVQSLLADPAYAGIDVDREYAKMARWCQTNRKQATQRRFINWLNRIDQPLTAATTPMNYEKF